MSFLRKVVLVSLMFCFAVMSYGTVTFSGSVQIGYQCEYLAGNLKLNQIYLTTQYNADKTSGGRIQLFNTETNSTAGSVTGFNKPIDVAVYPDLNYFCVTTEDNDFCIYNGGSFIYEVKTVDLDPFEGYEPCAVDIDTILGIAFVGCSESNKMILIDLNNLNDPVHSIIDLGHTARRVGVCVNSETHRVYVTNYLGSSVTVLDYDGGEWSVMTTIPVGIGPLGVCVSQSTNKIYTANYGGIDDDVSIIDGAENSVITTIGVGSDPRAFAVNPELNRIYVACVDRMNGGTLHVIDGSTDEVIQIVENINILPHYSYSSDILVNPETDVIYIVNYSYWTENDYGLLNIFQDGVTGIEESLGNPSSLSFEVLPNPFNSLTEFVLNLPEGTDNADFCIYDVSGKLVKSFPLNKMSSPTITISWDGNDYAGNKCAAGLYFGVLRAENCKPTMGKAIKLQ